MICAPGSIGPLPFPSLQVNNHSFPDDLSPWLAPCFIGHQRIQSLFQFRLVDSICKSRYLFPLAFSINYIALCWFSWIFTPNLDARLGIDTSASLIILPFSFFPFSILIFLSFFPLDQFNELLFFKKPVVSLIFFKLPLAHSDHQSVFPEPQPSTWLIPPGHQ